MGHVSGSMIGCLDLQYMIPYIIPVVSIFFSIIPI